ncbi:MAG: homoserine kinase [Myxococcota bacterium]|nr:homoserine kinase [Myxococcota bacterium]
MAVYTPLSDSELRQYLQIFDAGELLEAQGVGAGTINTIYDVRSTQGRFIVRILEGRTRADAKFEESLLGHLRSKELRVPTMLTACQSGKILSLGPRQQLSIFDYMNGRELAVFEISEAHVQQVGEFIADMHLACRDLQRRRRNRFGLERLRELIATCLDTPVGQMNRENLEVMLEQLEMATFPRSLPKGIIHGDLFVDNVRFSHGKLEGVIDFEMASSGPLIYDLAVAICDWCFMKDSFNSTLARELVRGYIHRRGLSNPERRALYGVCCFVAIRFAITRFYDFEVNVDVAATRNYKDYRHFMRRLYALKDFGREAFDALVLVG